MHFLHGGQTKLQFQLINNADYLDTQVEEVELDEAEIITFDTAEYEEVEG